MESIQPHSETRTLVDFCEGVVSRHKNNWPPSEDALGHEFFELFPFEMLFNLERITQFSETLGIQTSATSLPDRLSGFNCSLDGKKFIVLREEEVFPGGREHTFFHEVREILEYIFRDLGFPTVGDTGLEQHAEGFAVQMRILGATKLCGFFLEHAAKMEPRWKRWLSYAGILLLAIGQGLSCVLLPHAEDRFSSRP